MAGLRIGVVAILVEQHRQSAKKINEILSEYASCIRARLGVPNEQKDLDIIALIVEVTTEQLGALTWRLGNLEGVTVKSLLTNKSYEVTSNEEPGVHVTTVPVTPDGV